jgi:hypothetical protein
MQLLRSHVSKIARPVLGGTLRNPCNPAIQWNARAFAAVGDKIPAIEVDFGFPPEKVDMAARLKGKKTIIVGLPGAFTPV